MFPNKLFPISAFPKQVFPFGIGQLTHTYSNILLFLQDVLFASEIFGQVRSPITLYDDPFPIAGGPCAYIIPGESETINAQHMGAGRYFYGFDGYFTIRVMGESLKDYAFVDTLRLTDLSTGLLRYAHKVIDLLDIRFAVKTTPDGSNLFPNEFYPSSLFPASVFPKTSVTVEKISQEPMVLISHSPVKIRKKAENISAIDLKFKVPYTVTFQNPIDFDDPWTSEPLPSNLADLLLAVKDKILVQEFLNEFQAMISLSGEPFPLVGTPFCVIAPDKFSMISGDKYGAGRYFSTMEGEFTVSPVIQNITDISEYANNALSDPSSFLSLYSCAQYLMERLCLTFLRDPQGNFIAENPLDLVKIGEPRYYKDSPNLLILPLTFKVRYQENLTKE